MKPLDQVVRDRIAPALLAAGFQRKGRSFRVESDGGDVAFIEVTPFKLGQHEAEFFVDLGVQPRVWFDFVNRDGGQTRDALWADRLQVPGRRPPMADHWSFDLDDDQAGDRLTEALSARLPELLSLLDPAVLLDYARTLPRPDRKISVRPEVALPLLLASQGRSAELERRLAALAADRGDGWAEFDAEVVAFVNGWLAEHEPGRQV